MLIATLIAEREEDVLKAANAAAAHADALELRLDRMPALRGRLAELLPRMPAPVIVTCRREDDGGGFTGGEEERRSLLRRAARAGAAWIDVEWRSAVEQLAEDAGPARVIVSHHDWQRTPEGLERLCGEMQSRPGAAMVKLVTRARNLEDNLKIRDLLSGWRGALPLAAFCSGDAGTLSRVLGLSWGSAAAYGSAGREVAAPGQIPVDEMKRSYRVRDLGCATGVVGLAGYPLGHSLSPAIHNAAFRALDLDLVYVPLEARRIEPLVSVARRLPLRGFSVTLPHKETIVAHLDSADAQVRRIGAANTVVCKGEVLEGFNTDARAGVEPLARRVKIEGCRVAVLGAGGAARAVVHLLAEKGASVTVFNRTEATARRLARDAGAAWKPLGELSGHDYQVLIHATPVGMAPRTEELALPADWLRGELIYDIVYHPRDTALLREARRRGIATLDGLEMFLEQAAEQFRRFTGRPAPRTVMEQAATERLAALSLDATRRGDAE